MPGYRELHEICRGPDLAIYRGVDATGRSVIVKMPSPGLAPHAIERARTALRREYALLSEIDDPGVVKAIALEPVQDRPALVFEDAGPQGLAASLVGKPVDVGRFFELAIPLAEILARLHARGIVHRNVSPANVVLGPGGRMTLVDFASATRVESAAAPVAPGTIEGISPYASPEQTGRTALPIDHRSDLYSLGATFYTLLTGAPPFQSADPLEIVHRHLARAPTRPSVANPSIPELLSDIVLKLLAKMPEHRYQSAEAVVADLREAKQRWLATHEIERFALGNVDLVRELEFPEQLYGRDRELAVLREAADRVATGGTEVILVSGVAGIGKTALVDELRTSVARQGGLFAAGKFALPLGHGPYAAIAAALRAAVRETLSTSPPAWRDRLASELGADGGTMLRDLFPELAQLIEAPASPPRLDPAEAETRYHHALQDLVRAIARVRPPFALFLDDLQWADEDSLRFLSKLAIAESCRNVLLVISARSEDLGPEAPARRVIDALHRTTAVTELVLAPLAADAIARFCADTFRTDPAAVREFAELVARKTAGNPFFVRALLRSFQRDGLIAYDARAAAWTWDLARLEQVVVTDNVVDLMIATIQRLSRPTRELLEVAACIGHRVPLDLLAAASGQPEAAAAKHLGAAVRHGLLVAVDASPGATPGAAPDERLVYGFVHDRVHQAAYSLPDDGQRAAFHWKIGLAMMDRRPTAHEETWLFEMVDQLDRGATQLDEVRRIQLTDLNQEAGRKARDAAAFASALAYFRKAIELSPDLWERRHDQALALYRDAAECANLSGDHATSRVLVERALPHAVSVLEKTELINVQVSGATMRGASDEAIRVAIEGLRLFGIELPSDLPSAMRAEQARIDELLHGRPATELAEARPIQSAEDGACLELFARMMPAAIFERWELYGYLGVLAVRLTLERGRSPHAAAAYAGYARILLKAGDYERADAFGRLALQLLGETKSRAQECKVLVIIASFVSPWRAPLSASVPLLERCIEAGLAAGELEYVAYGQVSLAAILLSLGGDLNAVLEACDRALAFCVRTDQRIPLSLIRTMRQAVRCLKGYTARLGSFDDAEFDEATYLASQEAPITSSEYHDLRLRTGYLLGDLAGAELSAKSGAMTFEQVNVLVDHQFYLALTLAALARQRSGDERRALLGQAREPRRLLGMWAANYPPNFRHKQLLVEAELARSEGRPITEIAPRYEEAIALAAREGFVSDQALGSELLGRAHLASGRLRSAVRCLQTAIQGFAAWGASAKVASLEAEFPDRATESTLPHHGAAADLDLLSALKAAGAIASEIDLDRLLEKLIHVCAEAAGAERGILVLEEGGQAFVRAAGIVGQPVALGRTPLAESHELPRTIIDEVRERHLTLTLEHAARDPRFASDPYVKRHAVKSVMAVPLMRQASLIGTLYFENNLATGAFTPGPVKVLDLLTTQVATSLQISQLVEKLTLEIRDRTRAEAEVRFLADSSSTFAESLDYEATLARVARQAVPFLGDWCFVDLIDDQHQIRRVASAQGDGSREIVDEIDDHYAATWQAPEHWLRVLQTGEPLVSPRISYELLKQNWPAELARHVAQVMNPKSALVVPLMVHGRILGAISLASRTPEAFGPRELRIAQELARRAAIAIENARLYAEARQAIEIRNEFLSVASHELYTPITSMNLAIQGIQSGAIPRTPQAYDRVFGVTARQIQRLTRLIEELLNVSRIDAGRLRLEPEAVDLVQLAREISQRFEEDLSRSGSSMAIHAEAPVVGIWDSLGLEQVIVNLVSNAIKFGAGKPIEIAIQRAADMARLVVVDHGTGISPDRLPHIFERFERGVTTRQYGGLGLGLYIVKGIVDALGGVVHVDSTPGRGSTFTVELPLAGPPDQPVSEQRAEGARQGA